MADSATPQQSGTRGLKSDQVSGLVLVALALYVWWLNQEFPVGTLAVNLLGCWLIGFLGGMAEQRRFFVQELRLFLFIGVLGGFTTFSAFAFETANLLRDSRIVGAWLNVGLQVLLGLLAVRLGLTLSRWI